MGIRGLSILCVMLGMHTAAAETFTEAGVDAPVVTTDLKDVETTKNEAGKSEVKKEVQNVEGEKNTAGEESAVDDLAPAKEITDVGIGDEIETETAETEDESEKGEEELSPAEKALPEEDRGRPVSRFKQKAIEKTLERAEREKAILERQQEPRTAFREKALEQTKERTEKAEKLKEKVENKESKFAELARQRAEERAEKRRRQIEKTRSRGKYR